MQKSGAENSAFFLIKLLPDAIARARRRIDGFYSMDHFKLLARINEFGDDRLE